MNTEERIECLREKRKALKQKIKAERNRTIPDDLGIQRMKREKCRLKDEILSLQKQTQTAIMA